MKIETEQDIRRFTKTINELREETGHHERIDKHQIMTLKWIWGKARYRSDAKAWFRVELGW